MDKKKIYSLEELDQIDSPVIDSESANTYSLEDIERIESWSEPTNGMVRILENFGKGIGADIARVPEQVGSLIKEQGEKGGAGLAIPSFRDGVAIVESLVREKVIESPTDESFIRIGENLKSKGKEISESFNLEPTDSGKVSKLSFDLGGAFSSVITSIGMLYATKNPTIPALVFGSRQKAEIYEEARNAAKTPEEASAISTAAGLIEGGVETIGGVSFLKAISFDKWIVRSLVRAGVEALEESTQQIGEELITQLTGVRKDNLTNTMLRIGYAAAIGFITGAPVSAVVSSIEKTSIKKELNDLGFNENQANILISKVTENSINDGSVKYEIERFVNELSSEYDSNNLIQKNTKTTNKSSNESKSGSKETSTAVLEESAYKENIDRALKKKKINKFKKGIGDLFEKGIVPISTRLNDINPKLKTALRKYEFNIKNRILEDELSVKPFLEKYTSLEETIKLTLDLALKNGDAKKINEIIEENNMQSEYRAVTDTLAALYIRAKNTGIDIGYQDNYFPRKVSDFDGMMEFFEKKDVWPMLNEALEAKASQIGRELTREEKAELLNTVLRGYKNGKIKLSKPGQLKDRKIDHVTQQLNDFYLDSSSALVYYINRVNDFIESRKFFGKSAKGVEMNEKTLEDSIGQYINDLLAKGEITGLQASEVSEILKARFMPKGPEAWVSTAKNISYIDTMGNITSAITQIGDISFSLYKNGFYLTGQALSKTVFGNSEITKEDVGISRIAEEFETASKSGKALRKVFKWTGLEWMDTLGKQTTINASYAKYKILAEQNNKDFIEQINFILGDESAQTIKDFKEDRVSDNVKFLLFNELADVQPITLSEMPQGYLSSGNARVFYMLKTYSIKQLDILRNEAFKKIATKGQRLEGIQNLIKLAGLIALMNGTADAVKDFLLGRPIELKDIAIDNLLRLFGFSKYGLWKAREEGFGGLISSFSPPMFRFAVNLGKDIEKYSLGDRELKDFDSIQSIPFGGKLYYWWFGRGREKIEKRKRKGNKRRGA